MRSGLGGALLLAGALVLSGCRGDGAENEGQAEDPPPPVTQSGGEDAVPSCYAAVNIGAPAPAPTRHLFILVDQTTGLDDRLRETIRANVQRMLGPGTRFTVATFSAYNRGHYTTVRSSGTIEAPLTESQRLNLPAPRVEEIAGCLEQQRAFATNVAANALAEATSASASSFSHSEIMGSLKQLSEAVRGARARETLVIIVSDLLEHSSATSFYANRDLRLLDPAAEIRKAEEHDLFGQFGGARVAVIGAGLSSPESGEERVRETQKLNSLQAFWRQWFEGSNARLVAYGQPDLVAPIPAD